jgi:hypothetical protein
MTTGWLLALLGLGGAGSAFVYTGLRMLWRKNHTARFRDNTRRVILLCEQQLAVMTDPEERQTLRKAMQRMIKLSEAEAEEQVLAQRVRHFVLATAVRLLPPSERARYLEEFRAELLDVPGDTQLRHSLSLLRGVFVMRLRRGLMNTAGDAAVRRAKD